MGCYFFVSLILYLVLDLNLHHVGAENDPTLLRPNTHESIIDEKDDGNPSKQFQRRGQIKDVSYTYFNYRIGKRTDRGENAVRQVTAQESKVSKNAEVVKSGSTGLLEQLINSTQFVNKTQRVHNTGDATDLRQHASRSSNNNNNDSIAKALAFYESILANARKNSQENRNMKSETAEEKQKNFADGTELSSKDDANVCRSAECKHISKYIKNSLDNSTDPCNDFYKFACGGWKQQNKIPESENEITTFTKLTKKIEKSTHTLLTQPAKPGQSEALDKARKFFASCMDEEKIEANGAKPALDFIKSIGGWGMCGNKDLSENWDVYKVMKDVQSKYYPAPPFFTVEVTNDHLNSTRHLIKIDQSGLSLQREIYEKHPQIVEDYTSYMKNITKLLGYNCENITDEVQEIMDFEISLAKMTTSAEAKQAGTFRRINVQVLGTIVPHFPWRNHLKHIFESETKLRKAEVILSTSPVYLYKVTAKMKSTPKRILSKYIVWQMLRDKISFLSKPFRRARAAFNRQMTGVKDNNPRWQTCTGVTNDNMGVPIGTLYVENYFKEITKEKTQEMIKEIIQAFVKRIEKHKWIDEKTKKGILEKTDALVAKVGYATYILQPEELNKRFKKLEVGDDFFVNNLNVDKWIRMRLFGKLRKTVDKTKWPMFPQTINAMYQFYENEIVIPAGILQPPFHYEGDVPRALSYGAIGSIIGHELTHGFDNTGRKFDKNGDIVKEWWSKSALAEFQKREDCIRNQYSKYKVQDKYPVSGQLTLGENIADNGGTKLAYDAYIDWLMMNGGTEPRLPNLPYDNKQLFFIGYAQEYCANVREKTEHIATLSEIHAPSKFRVIGTLSNTEEFSKAFNCPKSSKMNPKVKCEIW